MVRENWCNPPDEAGYIRPLLLRQMPITEGEETDNEDVKEKNLGVLTSTSIEKDVARISAFCFIYPGNIFLFRNKKLSPF